MSLYAQLCERFEFQELLGRGAYGDVHRVIAKSDQAEYALKLMQIPGDGGRERREIAASLRLENPRVIRCYEGAVVGEHAYLLMELADDSLGSWVPRLERLPQTWRYLKQAGEGVATLHWEGMVHRDLKPANLLLKAGQVKIADLGLSRGMDLATVTATGTIVGTPGYLAPEQALGEKVGPACDVFALAVMFYEALEGRLPYAADDEDAIELLQAVARGEIQDFSRALHMLPAEVLDQLRAGLDPDPSRRPADILQWVGSLGEPQNLGELSLAIQRPLSVTATPSGGGTLEGRRLLPRLRGPSTLRATRQISRRAIPLAAVCVLGSLVAGVLTAPEPAAPAAAAVEADAGQDRGDAWGPFEPGYAEALRAELTDSMGVWVDPEDRPLPEGGPRSEGARPLIDGDPASWDVAVRNLPRLQRFYDWLAGDGRPEAMPAGLRQQLEATDAYFTRQDLPRPFAPYLAARPEGGDEEPPILTGRVPSAAPLPPGEHWLGTSSRLALLLFREQVRLGSRLLELAQQAEEKSDLQMLRFWAQFQKAEDPRTATYFSNYFVSLPARRGVRVATAPIGEACRGLLYCLRRVLRDEPGHAELAATNAAVGLLASRDAWYTEALGDLLAKRRLQDGPVGPRSLLNGLVASLRLRPLRILGHTTRAREIGRAAKADLLAAFEAPAEGPIGVERQLIGLDMALEIDINAHDWEGILTVWDRYQDELWSRSPERWWKQVSGLTNLLEVRAEDHERAAPWVARVQRQLPGRLAEAAPAGALGAQMRAQLEQRLAALGARAPGS